MLRQKLKAWVLSWMVKSHCLESMRHYNPTRRKDTRGDRKGGTLINILNYQTAKMHNMRRKEVSVFKSNRRKLHEQVLTYQQYFWILKKRYRLSELIFKKKIQLLNSFKKLISPLAIHKDQRWKHGNRYSVQIEIKIDQD